MVLYQSLIRNLFCALYNLSVSVLLLLASVLAKAGRNASRRDQGRDAQHRHPRDCGEKPPNVSIAPQVCDEGYKLGVPHPKTLLPTGC